MKLVSEVKARKWMWFGLAALAAAQLYYVQEMLAALLLFAILFAAAAMVALILYLVDRAGESALEWAEPRVAHAAKSVRISPLLEEASKRLHHRPRSQTAP